MINEDELKSITQQIIKRLVSEGQTGDLSDENKTCTITGGICMNCGNWQCIIQNRSAVDNVINAGADRISTNPGISSDAQKLASMIDHTLLKPEATINQIKTLCTEARRYKFASVCINPAFVSICRDELTGSDVKVCTVIGFPLGSVTTLAKAFETRDAIANGAGEIDMVINIGLLKSKHDKNVEDDIRAVVEAAMGSTVKVILETALLTDDEIIRACKLSKQAGAHFVKTSTGFAKSGASVHAVELMRQTVGPHMGVKASGGIRNFNDADKMIKAGASRIGASASVAIIKKEGSTSDY